MWKIMTFRQNQKINKAMKTHTYEISYACFVGN